MLASKIQMLKSYGKFLQNLKQIYLKINYLDIEHPKNSKLYSYCSITKYASNAPLESQKDTFPEK